MAPDFQKLFEKYNIKVKYAINEKAPMFLYTALKEGENILFAKRDRKKWQVIMDLDWFIENILESKINYIICPHCNKRILNGK